MIKMETARLLILEAQKTHFPPNSYFEGFFEFEIFKKEIPDKMVGYFSVEKIDGSIGGTIAPEHRGNGYAPEVLQALAGFVHGRLQKPYLEIRDINEPSKKSALKAGFIAQDKFGESGRLYFLPEIEK